MKKRNKNLALLLTAVLCLTSLAGCAAPAGSAADAGGQTVSAPAEADTSDEAAGDEAPETKAEAADYGDAAAGNASDSAASGDADASEASHTSEAAGASDKAAASGDAVIRVGGLKGPTTMGLVKLMDDAQNGLSQNQYEFTMVTAADELTGLVASGRVDIALLPANVASILYQKTQGGIAVIDINTLGVLYLVSADTSVSSMEQLRGKTVYLPGKGTTPEYALRYLIESAGLSEDDVTLEFKSEAAEVASILAEKPGTIGLLPQPFVTSALAQNESLSIIMDLTEVWDSYQSEENPGRLVTGVTIVNREFLNAHRELVDTFLKEHEASIQFTSQDPEAAAALIAEAGIVPKAPIAQKALPYCNITFLSGKSLKNVLEGYLFVLYEQDPASVGGALPDNAFYYIP